MAVDPELVRDGVYTCSSGNFAQALAWSAEKLGIHCTTIVPDNVPVAKVM